MKSVRCVAGYVKTASWCGSDGWGAVSRFGTNQTVFTFLCRWKCQWVNCWVFIDLLALWLQFRSQQCLTTKLQNVTVHIIFCLQINQFFMVVYRAPAPNPGDRAPAASYQ